MAKVLIPTPLRQYVEKKDVVEASGGTVAEVLASVVTEHPSLKKQIYTDEGKLRSFVNVYLNDEDIRYIDKEKSAVAETDTLSIVPSIAGGL
jgi:adenylyltransferase/sulfurtransferase